MLDVQASTKCHMNTRDRPIECRMIEGIEDFLKHTEKDEHTMFYNGNDVFKKRCIIIASSLFQVQAKKETVKSNTR